MKYYKNYYEDMDFEQNLALQNVDKILKDADGFSSFEDDFDFDDDFGM